MASSENPSMFLPLLGR